MTQLINASVVGSDIATQSELDSVIGTVSGINKSYVGLGNVDNTSDLNKPVSTATTSAIGSAVSGITKTSLGLSNVDNTSDTNKPISTLTATALSGKQATLVSATNIRTINGASVLGSGDLVVSGGGGGGGLTGFRNRIINGDMRIDQRNNGVAVTPTGSVFLLDRWSVALAAASKLTFQQVVDAPAGTKNSLKVTVAAQYAPSVSNQFAVLTKIEGVDVTDMQLGLATAATITTSLWVKGSVAGTYSCFLTNAASNRSYIGTIAVTTSWVRQSVVLTCDTAGAWATDNTTGLTFGIDLGSGSGLNGTAGAWAGSFLTRTSGSVTFVNQVAGSTLNITGVQLELGSTATTFEQRPYSVELALCQRYLPCIDGGCLTGLNVATTVCYLNAPFPVPARVPATGVIMTVQGSVYNRVGANYVMTSITFIASNGALNSSGAFIQAAATSAALTVGDAGFQYGGKFLFTGCEL